MSKLDRFYSIAKFIVFGAGEASIPVNEYLKQHDKQIVFYADNNSSLHGSFVHGVEIISPGMISELLDPSTGIIIASSAQSTICAQLVADYGITDDIIFPYMTEMFAAQYGQKEYYHNHPYLEDLLSCLADQASKDYVNALISFRRSLQIGMLERNPKATGFYDYLGVQPFVRDDDVIIDCGAYIGDTAENFLGRAKPKKIYAVEGLGANHSKLCNWIESTGIDNVYPMRMFLGSVPGKHYLNVNSSKTVDPRASIRSSNQLLEEIQVARLDDVIPRGEKVSLLKIDVEGADLDVLMGAQRLITECQPRIMVAAYHKSQHIWQIPKFLLNLYPNALLYAGHHPKCVHEIEYYLEPLE